MTGRTDAASGCAFTPESRGQGLAREAAGAALRFAHDVAGLRRVVAVAREANIGSRTVLGAIGMRESDAFMRGAERMLEFESVRG
jgi:RimJ/RimL family protein N-acetyltransferase